MILMAKTQLSKWGNSLAIRIPKPLAESAGVREGDALAVSQGQGGVIVLSPARRKYRLKDLVAKITAKNCHHETEWGKPAGKEVW